MRRVEIYEWQRGSWNPPRQKVKVGEGIFHAWGVDYEEFESGPGNYSAAIVELEDGTVKSVHAEMIRFVDQSVIKEDS